MDKIVVDCGTGAASVEPLSGIDVAQREADIASSALPLPLAQRMAVYEAPGTVARKLEEVINHLLNGAELSPQAAQWLADRKAERGA